MTTDEGPRPGTLRDVSLPLHPLYNQSSSSACSLFLDRSDRGLHVSYRIFFASSMTVFFVGLIGNTLSLCVFSSKELRAFSANVYLMLLSVSDTLYLVAILFSRLMTPLQCWYVDPSNKSIDIINQHPALCKLFQYASDLFADFSTCLILAFTVERCLAVYLPIDFKGLCSPRKALFIGLSVGGVQAALIAPYHFLYIDLNTDTNICTVLDEDAFTNFYIAECVLFRVTPVLAIIVLNIFIGSRVLRVSKDRQRRRARNGCLINGGAGLPQPPRCKAKEDRRFQVTIMLILVSTTHVILYVPVMVHYIMLQVHRRGYAEFSERVLTIAQNYTRSLYISGFALNFLLYAISGRVFREQVSTILGKCLRRRRTVGNHHQQVRGHDPHLPVFSTNNWTTRI